MIREIKIENLKKTYPKGANALKGINLDINRGDFFALLGPNGAGKSTLVKILTTLAKKDYGDVLINNVSPESNFNQTQRRIGVVSQDNELDPKESPESILIFQALLFGFSKKEATSRMKELITLFQLENEQKTKIENLSGGNKRRLHCALALVHKPKVLFLDEPTVGMDPVARATFWKAICELNTKEQTTIFLTTQYLEEADQYALKMALLIEGEIHFRGEVSAFKRMVQPNEEISLEKSYLEYIQSLSKN